MPAASARCHAWAESTSIAASPLSPGQIAGIASGCSAHHCSTCWLFVVRALKPPGTSGALSCPQGKTGQPAATSVSATSRIPCPFCPRRLASTSPCSALVRIGLLRAPDVDQLPLLLEDDLLRQLHARFLFRLRVDLASTDVLENESVHFQCSPLSNRLIQLQLAHRH